MAGFFKTVTFIIVLVFAAVVFAEEYDVGDDTKWSRPTDPEFYNTWAASKTFQVGDELEFEFDAERHDVAIVTADAYENCEKETPLSHITTSPAKIMLNDTGPQYFICTFGDHCRFGQKLTVNVVDDAGGHSGGGGARATPPAPGGAKSPGPGGATTPASGGAPTPAAPGGATAPGGAATAPGAADAGSPTTSGGAGTTAPTGSSETTAPPTAESTASSLGGASFMVAFVSAVVALF